MKASIDLKLAILAYEGVILSAYQDIAGVWTIGVGHTAARGNPKPEVGMTLSLEEVLRVFEEDIVDCEREVLAAVTTVLNQRQFDAIVSWQFNLGRIGRADVTLTKRLNQGRLDEAADELLRWDKATVKGEKRSVVGLTRRRVAEREMFLRGEYGSASVAVCDKLGQVQKVYARTEMAKLLGGSLDGRAPSQPESRDGGKPMPTPDFDGEEEFSATELAENPASRLLPKYRPRQADAVTLATLAKFSYLLPSDRRGDAVKILAVRGYFENTLGIIGRNDRGLYDDAIFVVEPKGVHNFNANTDPSAARPGIAQLKAPQAVRYRPGNHNGKRLPPYPAFRQDASCVVVRDDRGDDTGNFGINLHRGGLNGTSSEGCQTVPPHQWTEFKALVDNLLAQNGQTSFYYLLINNADLATAVMPEERKMPEIPAPRPDQLGGNTPELLLLLQRLIEMSRPPVPAPPQPPNLDLREIIAVLKQLSTSQGQIPLPPKIVPTTTELTPVNGALGPMIGKLLDGKKTGLGTVGLLLTTLLPQLVTLIPAIGPVAGFINAAAPVLIPIFTALTGWGALGKVDKWFATRV
jgi:lysozyme